MAGRLGAFGPVRFPVFPPSAGVVTAAPEVTADDAGSPVLLHVQGFNASARPPLTLLDERRGAVAAGKLIVLLELDSRKQQFITGHSHTVVCLAYSPEQALGASGQLRREGSSTAEVLLWDPETLQLAASFSFHQADVEAIGFAQGGEVLISIAADRDRTMALWPSARSGKFRMDRRKGGAPLLVCSAYKGGSVYGVVAAPGGTELPPRFATFGASHVKFWQSDRLSPSLDGRRGAFGPEGAPRMVVAAAWVARDRLVVGGSDGEVFFFEGTRAVRRVQQQHYSVAMLLPLRDSLLVVYSHGICSVLRSDRSVDLDIAGLDGAPDSRSQSPIVGGAAWRQSSLLLASRTHLLRLDLSAGVRRLESCKVLISQPSRALTAVAAHPVEPRIFTGALDGWVRCYRSDTHQPLPGRSFKASSGVTCLAVSGCAPGGAAWLAVGCDDATLSVLGESSFHYVLRRCLSQTKAKLTCARFSACDVSGTHPLWLAVGTDDGCIHTFRFKDATSASTVHSGAEVVTKAATLRGHAAPIVDLAFADTLPSVFLLSVDAAGQALAFDVPMARRLPSIAVVKDVPFSPWTSPLGWQVLGCWEPQPAVESAVLPSRRFCELTGRSMIAVSNAATPAIELFPFPCPSPPSRPPPRLDGPTAPVAAVLHSSVSDQLVAASDTVLFAWGWQRRSRSEPLQDKVQLSTPECRHRVEDVGIGSADGSDSEKRSAVDLTPQPPTPPTSRHGKENVRIGTSAGRRAESLKALPTPPPLVGASPAPLPRWAWEGDTASPSPDEAPGRRAFAATAAFGDVQASPAAFSTSSRAGSIAGPSPSVGGPPWAWSTPQPPPAGAGARARANSQGALLRRARSRDVVAPKIGAIECGDFAHVAGNTLRIREDTEARARSIHERQQFDTVGLLLTGGHGQQGPVGIVAPEGGHREGAAGRFLYRVRDGGDFYEVEVQLPGGRLARVMRNPFRRTLTFEGEAASAWSSLEGDAAGQEERLVVRIPPGFDLAGPPDQVEQGFAEGRCRVVVARRRHAEAGGAGAGGGGGGDDGHVHAEASPTGGRLGA